MEDQIPPIPGEEPKKKNNTVLIIAIVAVVILCCCCLAAYIIYSQYDNWGDPLGIYGWLPQVQSLLLA